MECEIIDRQDSKNDVVYILKRKKTKSLIHWNIDQVIWYALSYIQQKIELWKKKRNNHQYKKFFELDIHLPILQENEKNN